MVKAVTGELSVRPSIVRAYPELEGSTFQVLAQGWYSTAVEVDGRLIFTFPKHEAAKKALLKEASVIAAVRSHVSIPVPEMRIHRGPLVFSRHEKLHGEHLLPESYRCLSEAARDLLAEALGGFHGERHLLKVQQMKDAGAAPIESWQSPEAVRAKRYPD